MYAAFLNASGHDKYIAPRFEIKITHVVSGKEEVITCGQYKVVADATNTDFKKGKKDGNDTWLYTEWKKVAVDLTNYIGKVVTIEFTTADCFLPRMTGVSTDSNGKIDSTCSGWGAGSHGAYAYIDMYCAKVDIPSPTICANKASVEVCAPPGYLSYSWPPNQPGFSHLTINNVLKLITQKQVLNIL